MTLIEAPLSETTNLKCTAKHSWHSPANDLPLRRGMIYIIKKIFEKNGKLSKSKLVLLKHIELNLYASASSFEEYANISTLKERIVAVAKKRCMSANMSVEKP